MSLSMKTKQEICQRKNEVPSLSIDQLSAEYSCDRSTISKILKKKDKWLTMQLTEPQEKIKVNQPAKFVELENAMDVWMRRVLLQNGILTDRILQVQAKKFAELLDIPEDDFKANQITVLLCTNTTGTYKLKPLVIGKSPKPHCFKGVQKANLGVEYNASKKAWMTSAIFERWINSLNSLCQQKRKKILLLVDGASSHPKNEHTHIKLHILPPHTTPYL
ncbi:15117_t:CDS:2 [Gigaspora margarita]|uniref:15117_t:CDS:1 n=1 Tax=Gigaspora margarita TaxID=4874 RepID=A0ABN7UEF8_GIGMA|nr:15117_t:CDS:2 [Gigaspora margarita]